MRLRNKETGETGYLELEKGDDEKYTGLRVYKNDFMYKRYDSLAGVLEEWEDYKPKEPLIKDEKTRKAVRAWADMQGSEWIVKETDQCCRDSLGYFFNSIKEIFGDLELGEEYTIAELCGEEEE